MLKRIDVFNVSHQNPHLKCDTGDKADVNIKDQIQKWINIVFRKKYIYIFAQFFPYIKGKYNNNKWLHESIIFMYLILSFYEN